MYPDDNDLDVLNPSLKSSASVQLTPLLAIYVPALHSHSMKEAIRSAPARTNPQTITEPSGEASNKTNSTSCASTSAPTLRSCPLFSSHAVVICNSAAHTHVHIAAVDSSFTSSSTEAESDFASDAGTLVDMSSSLRFLPRAAARFSSLPVRRGARCAPIPTFRTFSGTSTLKDNIPPAPPAIEEEKLKKGEPATFLGTTKRLPEFNLVRKVVCVSGAGRGLGLVQAEALLEAGAIGIFSYA